MGIKSNMNKHTSQSKYIISCGKQHIKCRFKNQKQWLECNKSIFFPPSIVVCLDIFGWLLLLLLLLLLLSSHLAQSFVLFLFIHYRRCRYCYCHWLSLFDHFENKYKCHEIAKQTNERFLHYEINANDKTNNQFHMPSFVFLFHFRLQNLQPDNVDSSCLCMCKCADRNDFDVMAFFILQL